MDDFYQLRENGDVLRSADSEFQTEGDWKLTGLKFVFVFLILKSFSFEDRRERDGS